MNQQLDTLHGDAPLTVEQRLSALETWAARVSMRAHNVEWERQGHPADRIGEMLSTPDVKVSVVDITGNSDQMLLRLERGLAYSAARSDIECLTLRINGFDETPARWDTRNLVTPIMDAEINELDAQSVERAILYLDLIGCLQREADAPHIVSIKDLA